MLQVLYIAMFVGAAGQPQNAAPQPAPPAETAAVAPAQGQPAATETAAEPRRICHREIPTGSSLSRQVCRSVYQQDLEREIGVEILEQIQIVGVERKRR